MSSEIREIVFKSADYTKWLNLRSQILREPLGLSFHQDDIESERNQRHFCCFTNGVIVGGLVLVPCDDGLFKMRQVAVASTHQRKGIGQALVERAEAFVQAQKGLAITLHAREQALPFYQKLNYQIVGDQFEEIGIPHFKMTKTLAQVN